VFDACVTAVRPNVGSMRLWVSFRKQSPSSVPREDSLSAGNKHFLMTKPHEYAKARVKKEMGLVCLLSYIWFSDAENFNDPANE